MNIVTLVVTEEPRSRGLWGLIAVWNCGSAKGNSGKRAPPRFPVFSFSPLSCNNFRMLLLPPSTSRLCISACTQKTTMISGIHVTRLGAIENIAMCRSGWHVALVKRCIKYRGGHVPAGDSSASVPHCMNIAYRIAKPAAVAQSCVFYDMFTIFYICKSVHSISVQVYIVFSYLILHVCIFFVQYT